MKKNLILLSALFLIGITQVNAQCCKPTDSNAKTENATQQKGKTVKLKITGMTCAGCSNHISNALKEVDGIIVVFGNLGLWNGRRQGYQILGSNIADILKSQCDDAEWYGDGYNIRGRMGHHDGTNYTLYRIAKGRDEAERIADKIYNREIDEEGFRRRTRSLYPYVAAVYGWKTRQRKPDKAA